MVISLVGIVRPSEIYQYYLPVAQRLACHISNILTPPVGTSAPQQVDRWNRCDTSAPAGGKGNDYSYSYGLMELSKSICQLPLLVLPHLRPLGTSVGGKLHVIQLILYPFCSEQLTTCKPVRRGGEWEETAGRGFITGVLAG